MNDQGPDAPQTVGGVPTGNVPAGNVPMSAIGASAGGVRALQDFFAEVSEETGLAFIVITHLAPDQPSALSEILARQTRMPVTQVEGSMQIRPNCVYVIQPDRELIIEGNNVTSRPHSGAVRNRAPIDVFFRSAAAGRKDGLAMVLTGAGSDGALGVRAIKEGGGVIFAQNPETAEYPTMPRSAIETGAVDFVGEIPELAKRIAEVARAKSEVANLKVENTEHDIRQILKSLYDQTGHDFSSYKRTTLLRRILRRLQVRQITDLPSYSQLLRDDPDEARQLLGDLLISVTQFFRD